jgi:hypothetical protein
LHDGCFGIVLFRHFDESEAAGLAGVPVRYDVYALDITVLLKSRQQVVLSRLETKVPHEYVCHFFLVLYFDLSLSDCSGTTTDEGREEGRPEGT